MTQKCHFIGIGGIGMSGLARILLSKKVEVSGSDMAASHVTDGLSKAGAHVYVGHSTKNISPDMTVIYSSDIKKDNPEYEAAINLKCPLLHRSDLLLQLMKDYKTLAVAGTHGKTTTTSLLTAVLKEAGKDPAFAVGGILPQFQTNGGYGQGEYFVAEADESDGSFLKYDPFGAIVTNIDNDHMDYYKTDAALDQAFRQFLEKVASPEHLFWCGDDARLVALKPSGVRYGFSKEAALRISNFRQKSWSITFDIHFNGRHYEGIELALAGRHNALNGAAVFGMALRLGVSEEAIRRAFLAFNGVLRRCEKKGDTHGVLVLDDYGHHPTEIQTTLQGIREAIQERRMIVVFQPHRYTRTRDCLGSFGKIFDEVDELIVTDIYGARETPIPGISSDRIVKEVEERETIACRYIPREALVSTLTDMIRPHDVVVTLGAGDVTKIGPELVQQLKKCPPKPWKVGVICGGRSAEHVVSLMSAKYIRASLSKEYYDVVYFGVTKAGQWLFGPHVIEELEAMGEQETKPTELISGSILQELHHCDVLFPIMHGPFGEDGTIQGFFDMIGKPYVGCDHRASAICMDKAMTKRLMVINGIATSPFIDFTIGKWKSHRESLLQQIQSQLVYPLFVKPTHLGSTFGVSKVEKEEHLVPAIEAAFKLDHHVIVENGLDIREMEFAVMGNRWVTVLPPGEAVTHGKIYDFVGKYSIGPDGAPAVLHVDLPPEMVEEGKFLAETAYKAVGCNGLARLDFFLDRNGKFWLNEINPMPGCTPGSMYPKICQANGISAAELMNRLIILALDRSRQSHL